MKYIDRNGICQFSVEIIQLSYTVTRAKNPICIMHNVELEFEIKRKLFHLSSLIIPFIYILLLWYTAMPKLTMIVGMVIVTAIILYIDMSRHYNSQIKGLVDSVLVKLMRSKEVSGSFAFSGMSFFFLGSLLVISLFSAGLAITSIMVLIFADTAAALVGMRFGKKLANGKSILGSVAFILVTILVSMICYFMISYNTTFLGILITAILTSAAEFYSSDWQINDNILIPLVYSLSTFCLSFIL